MLVQRKCNFISCFACWTNFTTVMRASQFLGFLNQN